MSLHNANAAYHQEFQKQESYYGGYCLYEICYKLFFFHQINKNSITKRILDNKKL